VRFVRVREVNLHEAALVAHVFERFDSTFGDIGGAPRLSRHRDLNVRVSPPKALCAEQRLARDQAGRVASLDEGFGKRLSFFRRRSL
jgi:hypothetical protein